MSHRKNRFPKLLASRLALSFAAPMAMCAVLLASAPASAASLVSVTGWQMGTEPSNVSMYEYAPDGLPANAPVLVLVHYCSGNAQGIFGEAQSGGIVTQADQKKILLVVPQTSRNCWDVATTASLTHDAAPSETKAIVDQVKYAITKHNANPNRVYVMGASSGAMVTQALLAVYPDVFKAGAEFAGVPAGLLVGQRPRRSVELAVRERPGPAHPAGVGRHGARDVPRVHRIIARASSSGTGRPTASSTTPITPRPSTSGPTCSGCPRPRRRRGPCRSAATTTTAGNGRTPAGSWSSTHLTSPADRTVRTRT